MITLGELQSIKWREGKIEEYDIIDILNKNSIIGTTNLYHTNLRNVGLFSSLSMALLSFSEKGVLKKDISNKRPIHSVSF